MRKCVIIIQARMGSSRLPGKMTLEISGYPVLWHVIERSKKISNINAIIVATPEGEAENPIREIADKCSVGVFNGSETDVLGRYYAAAREHGATQIIRITGDCPLIDPEVVSEGLRRFDHQKIDYLSNNIIYTYPHGLDFEVFTFDALEIANSNSLDPFDREHVTYYITNNPEKFNIQSINLTENYHHLRVVLDQQEDLRVIDRVFEKYGLNAGLNDIIDLYQSEPEIFDYNKVAAENYISHSKREN